MKFARLWKSLFAKTPIKRRQPSSGAFRRSLTLETLEDRFAPAVLTVNTNADNNTRDALLSFREAVLVNTGALAIGNLTVQEQAQVNGGLGNDTISFAQASFNTPATSVITLANALPNLTANVTVQGLGANALTVRRDPNAAAFRIFTIAPNVNAALSGLTLSGGNAAAGGGIQNAGSLTLTSVVVSNNFATTGAGLTNLAGGTVNITGSAIHSNNAGDWGGGIDNQGVMTLVNSTVSSNTALNSPAGINNAGSLALTNVTVSANRSNPATAAPGNGIWQSDARGTLTLRNTIVAGNFGPGGAADDLRGPVVAASDFNIVGSAANFSGITNGTNSNRVGTAAAPVDAGLGILLANGGGTPTHALLQNSIAINAGTNGGIVPAQDQRGIARVGAVDMGAYEYTGFQPTWLEQGPSLIDTRSTVNGNGMVKVDNGQAVGAINAVAVHPTNPDILYAATVNGGVWKTTNGTSATPAWTPLTDTMPSLATLDVAFSPLDNTGNTVFVGTGSNSSLAGDGGRPAGIYRTTNGGTSWTQLGQNVFGGERNLRIGNVVATGLTTGNGQILLASTSDGQPTAGQDVGTTGLYRSADGGTTWVRISGSGDLPDAPISQLISNAAGTRFFAAVPNFGVYTSIDGVAWNRLGLNVGAATRVRLALQGTDVLYAAMLGAVQGERGTSLIGISRSADQGVSWVALNVASDATGPLFGGGQGDTNFAMVVDPNDPTIVYVAGDVQRNFAQAGGWVGRTFRGVFNPATPNQTAWTLIVSGDAATLGAPHADSRGMVFDRNGNLLQANDGGLYRLLNPNANTRRWISISGDMRITELHSIAFDPLNNVLIGGTQDNGAPQQDNGNLAYNNVGRFNWSDTLGGDGGIPRVETQSTPGQSVRFYSSQNFGGFTRRFYDAGNTSLQFGNPNLTAITGAYQFYQPYAINAVNPRRIVLGTRDADPNRGPGGLFESTDQGDTFTPLAGAASAAVGTATAYAYGGRFNGQAAEGILYVSTDLVDANGRGTILLRQTIGGAINRLPNYPGNRPVDLVVDPDNWRRLYVLDAEGRIWRSTDAGATFANATGNLVLGQGTSGGIDIYAGTTAANDEVIFVGGQNGVFASSNAWAAAGSQWTKFGAGLPNVQIRDIEYNASRNVLAVGTLGRGAWLIPQASDALGTPAPVLDLNGAAAGIDFAATWNQAGGATAIVDPTLTLTDGAGRLIASAQVFLTNFRDANVEALAANTAGTKIVAAYDPTTRVLSLTGADTAANYQQVLRTVTYNNASANPTAGARIVTFQATNDFISSFLARTTITVNGANVGPQVDLNGGGAGQDNRVVAPENAAPVPIAPAMTLSDGQSATIASARVILSARTNGAFETLSANTAGASITAQYDANTGILTLTGPDTTANFQQVLQTVTYQDAAENIKTQIRYATVIVNDGALNSAAYRVEIELQAANDAPVLDSSKPFALNDIDDENEGTEVIDLLASAGIAQPIADPDGASRFGIAIIGVDNTNGQWEVKIEGGGEGGGEEGEDVGWEDIEGVSAANALLLEARVGIRIRFVPNPGFLGAVTNGLQFRAWDISIGDPAVFPDAEGGYADASVNGGTSAFSTAVGNVNAKVVDTTMSYKQDKIVSPLPQGSTSTADSAGNRAWFLDQELNLTFAGTYYTGSLGRGEKWVRGNANGANNPWYFILPNGDFYSWNGTNKAEGTLIAGLPPLFYLQPPLLWNASRETLAVLIDQTYGLDFTNGNFDLNYGGASEKWARGAGGQWFFMYPNGKLIAWNGMLQQATGTLIAQLPSAYYGDFVNRVVTPAANQVTASIDNTNNLVIDPANGYIGDVYVKATTTSNNVTTSTLSFVDVKNSVPTATPIRFQSMSTTQNTLSLPLDGADADTGDVVTYSAFAGNAGYVLGQRFGLNRDPFGGYFQNAFGANEKWFRGINRDWFFIKPTGQFYQWDGKPNLGSSELMATLDPVFWDRPEWFANGQPQDLARVLDQTFSFNLAGNLYQNYGGQNEKWIFGAAESAWYFVKPDGSLWRWDGQVNKATGKRVADFDEAYWSDPSRLYNAPANQIATPTIVGGPNLVLDPAANFIGELWVLLRVADGKDRSFSWFTLDVTAN
ncbi:MAG: hypothetical protein K2X38_25530 [Gemmataceae bacterium]|nr:hypothetical protein [Gemmataceae bacterium]